MLPARLLYTFSTIKYKTSLSFFNLTQNSQEERILKVACIFIDQKRFLTFLLAMGIFFFSAHLFHI